MWTRRADGSHRSPDEILPEIIGDAAAGLFPHPDGAWIQVPPWRDGVEAIVSFTGFAVLAVTGPLPDRPVDGFGAAHDPRLVSALAGPDGWIDSLDVLLVARGTGAPSVLLHHRPDLADHPRVAFADAVRDRVRVFGRADGRDVAVLGRGIGGHTELSVEVEPGRRGAGRALIRDALTAVFPGKVVVAAVAPGNAASLRALLAAGFSPIGSVQLFRRS